KAEGHPVFVILLRGWSKRPDGSWRSIFGIRRGRGSKDSTEKKGQQQGQCQPCGDGSTAREQMGRTLHQVESFVNGKLSNTNDAGPTAPHTAGRWLADVIDCTGSCMVSLWCLNRCLSQLGTMRPKVHHR